MNETTAIATSGSQWHLILNQCKAFIASGLLPDHITKGYSREQQISRAITIAWKGQELGIPPLQALASISVIGGKPCLSSELMLSLIYQRCKGAKINFTTPTDKQHLECTVTMQRPDGDAQTFRFSIEDAKRANLNGTAWTKYPAAMLRARAISAGARAVFPDCIMGCYTPEEMGADTIEVEGEVIESKPVDKVVDNQQNQQNQQEIVPEINNVDNQQADNKSPFISEKQCKYLHVVMGQNGWKDIHIKAFIKKNLNIESTKEIPWKRFNDVLKYIEENPF